MAGKNYYLILGVSPETSVDQIRSAFRRLAKKHHPDKTGGERTAYFQEITEAYEILSDPEKRGSYNRKLEEEKALRSKNPVSSRAFEKYGRRGGRSQNMPDFATGNVFANYFDDSLFEESFPERGRFFRDSDVLELDAYLTPEEALRGQRVEVEIPVLKPCPECHGAERYFAFACPVCDGAGEYEMRETAGIDFPPGIRSETLLSATFSLQREKYLQLLIHVHIIHSEMKG